MVKNYDPATPDDQGPQLRSCNDCGTQIPDPQARRTFEIYDVPLCQACERRREEEIKAGRITPKPTEEWDASQAAFYEVYQVDPRRGRTWQAPDYLPLPPGAIGQGFHRPKPGGACFQLFRMPGDAPVPGTLEYYEAEARRQEDAAKATESPQEQSTEQPQGNPSPELTRAAIDARTAAYLDLCQATEDAIVTATLELLDAIRAQTRAVTEIAASATRIMRNEAVQVTVTSHQFFRTMAETQEYQRQLLKKTEVRNDPNPEPLPEPALPNDLTP